MYVVGTQLILKKILPSCDVVFFLFRRKKEKNTSNGRRGKHI